MNPELGNFSYYPLKFPFKLIDQPYGPIHPLSLVEHSSCCAILCHVQCADIGACAFERMRRLAHQFMVAAAYRVAQGPDAFDAIAHE